MINFFKRFIFGRYIDRINDLEFQLHQASDIRDFFSTSLYETDQPYFRITLAQRFADFKIDESQSNPLDCKQVDIRLDHWAGYYICPDVPEAIQQTKGELRKMLARKISNKVYEDLIK